MSAHVAVYDSCFSDGHVPRLPDELQACLARHFDVEHSTFQLEPARHAAYEPGHPYRTSPPSPAPRGNPASATSAPARHAL